MPGLPTLGVIGGGISGLACAHRLTELKETTKKNFNIVLLEAGARLGGIVQTEERDGFLLENGPDAFIREKPWALDLTRRLGIDHALIGTRELKRRSYILRKGRLTEIPEGFYLMAPTRIMAFLRSPLFSWPGKGRLMMEYFLPPSLSKADESLASFVRRRFGRECLENVAQALVAGIHTADPEKLSLLATFPRFRELEKQYGSVLRGLIVESRQSPDGADKASGARYSLFVSFKKGMTTLTDSLEKKVSPFVRLRTPVKNILWKPAEKSWEVTTTQGEALNFQAVCCALPPSRSRALFDQSIPDVSQGLAGITCESVATVHLAYRKEQLRRLPEGFGFVSPKKEDLSVLACTFVDQKFEGRCPDGYRLFRAFVGGAFGKKYLAKDDSDLLSTVESDLQNILGIEGKPLFNRLQRHPDAMIQYGVGHLDRVNALRGALEKTPGLFLTGAGFRGVGIPDCVHDAESQAEEMFKTLARQTD